MANNFTTGAFLKKQKKIKRSENLGKTVDMSLVDELVVRRSGAALMNAEEVLLGNIYELIQKGDKRKKKIKAMLDFKEDQTVAILSL